MEHPRAAPASRIRSPRSRLALRRAGAPRWSENPGGSSARLHPAGCSRRRARADSATATPALLAGRSPLASVMPAPPEGAVRALGSRGALRPRRSARRSRGAGRCPFCRVPPGSSRPRPRLRATEPRAPCLPCPGSPAGAQAHEQAPPWVSGRRSPSTGWQPRFITTSCSMSLGHCTYGVGGHPCGEVSTRKADPRDAAGAGDPDRGWRWGPQLLREQLPWPRRRTRRSSRRRRRQSTRTASASPACASSAARRTYTRRLEAGSPASSAPRTPSSTRRASTRTAASSRHSSARRTPIISDALNHASIIDGIRLCKAERHRYPNGDMAALEDILRSDGSGKRLQLIATDGVFSMDGYHGEARRHLRSRRQVPARW